MSGPRRNARRWTTDDRCRMLSMLLAGMSHDDVGAALGCAPTAVAAQLGLYGLAMKRREDMVRTLAFWRARGQG